MQAVRICNPTNFFLLLFFCFSCSWLCLHTFQKASIKMLTQSQKDTPYGNAQCAGVWLFWWLKTCISLLPNNAQRTENNLCKTEVIWITCFMINHSPWYSQQALNVKITSKRRCSDVILTLYACFVLSTEPQR